MNIRDYITSMLKDSWNKYSLVIVLCFIVAVLSMLHVILGFSKSPPGMVYLWTGHYYLDYFYYLAPIAQGSRGILLSFSQAATDDSTRFIHLWPYTFIGYITKFLNASPIAIYWITILILSFTFSFLIFVAISKLLRDESFKTKILAFIFTIFATPFFLLKFDGNRFQVNLFDFWYSMGTFFRRFEPIPHHLLSSIFSLIALLIWADLLSNINRFSAKKVLFKSFLMALLLVGVLSFNSFVMIVPLGAISLTAFLYLVLFLKKRKIQKAWNIFIFLAVLSGIVGIAGILLKNYYDGTIFASAFKNVEVALHQDPKFSILFLSLGPLAIFAPFGLRRFFEKTNPFKIIFAAFFSLSYIMYFSPIDQILGTHNGRFLSPLSYILLGSLSTLGVSKMSNFLGKQKKVIYAVLVLALILYLIPANVKTFIDLLKDRNISSPISYLPRGIIDGFRFLERYPSKGDALLTPSQFLGTVMPVYVNRKTYVARQIVTPDYIEKNIRTSNFYLGAMSNEQALDFLKKNGLKFVVLTSIEGYDVKPLYIYPFLKEIYKNREIVIFELIEST